MNLLILGGTADARHICQSLYQQIEQAAISCQLIYSVAGLVRQPTVSTTVISGGFSQHGGLSQYLQTNAIEGIIDATHPYAHTMSSTAIAAARAHAIPLWHFARPAWQPQTGDCWYQYHNRGLLFTALASYQRVLLSLGQVSMQELASLAHLDQVYLRTAAPPALDLDAQQRWHNVQWIQAIGPFDKTQEHALITRTQVHAIASKNSGGDATSAKLDVARDLGLPVHMLERPALDAPKHDQYLRFNRPQYLLECCMAWLHNTAHNCATNHSIKSYNGNTQDAFDTNPTTPFYRHNLEVHYE